jgi:hypothetical protein
MKQQPGKIAFLGSGETAAAGGKIYEHLAAQLNSPLQVSVLETPAGFELNAAQVAGRVTDYLRVRLQNYHPKVHQIGALRRGNPGGTDDPELLRPLLTSQLIFLGPGSPSYTVRQLQHSLAWQIILARVLSGASLALASAAVIASGTLSLPVYEIYKVGEDPFWKPGLDLPGLLGLKLVFFPHWNNRDGGEELDTRFCFMGAPRLSELLRQLQTGVNMLGIDEHTALVLDLAESTASVLGVGTVTIFARQPYQQVFHSGQQFPLNLLGDFHIPANLEPWISASVAEMLATSDADPLANRLEQPDEAVLLLLEERRLARAQQNWQRADQLRDLLLGQGWQVLDTAQGQVIQKSKTG